VTRSRSRCGLPWLNRRRGRYSCSRTAAGLVFGVLHRTRESTDRIGRVTNTAPVDDLPASRDPLNRPVGYCCRGIGQSQSRGDVAPIGQSRRTGVDRSGRILLGSDEPAQEKTSTGETRDLFAAYSAPESEQLRSGPVRTPDRRSNELTTSHEPVNELGPTDDATALGRGSSASSPSIAARGFVTSVTRCWSPRTDNEKPCDAVRTTPASPRRRSRDENPRPPARRTPPPPPPPPPPTIEEPPPPPAGERSHVPRSPRARGRARDQPRRRQCRPPTSVQAGPRFINLIPSPVNEGRRFDRSLSTITDASVAEHPTETCTSRGSLTVTPDLDV